MKPLFPRLLVALLVLAHALSGISAQAADPDVVSLVLIDGEMRSDWPDRGVVGFRRPASTGALTVNFTLGGSAVLGTDYTAGAGN